MRNKGLLAVTMVILLALLIAGCGGGGGSTAATGGTVSSGGGSSNWQTVWTAGWAININKFDQWLAFLRLQDIVEAQGQSMMRGIHTFDGNTVFSVGDNETIEKSVNGGDNWIDISTGGFDQLRDCKSPDGNEVWVAGMNGAQFPSLKKSTNGGVSFTNQAITGKTPTNISHIHKISAPAVNTFWAACEGGIILRMNDSSLLGTGRTQGNLENGTGNGFANIIGIYGVSADEAYFHSANGDLYRTQDRLVTEASYLGNFGSVKDIHVRATRVWMCGPSGRILYSSNSGGNFTLQNTFSGTPSGLNLPDVTFNKIDFQNNNKGVVVGTILTFSPNAVIYTTNDGGTTWQYDAPASSAAGAMNAVTISPSGRVFGAERAHIVRSQI